MNAVDSWIRTVAFSHSNSKATEEQYKRVFNRFCKETDCTPEGILSEYESCGDRQFRGKYAQIMKAWILKLQSEGLTQRSINVMLGCVKSFFKYNNLPLDMIPYAKTSEVFHNRDITRKEVIQVIGLSRPREKAFFSMMAQSGLRPHTIVQLKLKHLQPDYHEDTVPCKIDVPQELAKGKYQGHFTFMGEDALNYLRLYLSTRTDKLTGDSYLFLTDKGKPLNVKDESKRFRRAVKKLKYAGLIDFEERKTKPSEIRFYTLRKFFRKYANQMGFEHVNYMMGHTTKGSDSSYVPKDPEFYRELYKTKAMPFLDLSAGEPVETISAVQTQSSEIKKLKTELETAKKHIAELEGFIEDQVKNMPDRGEIMHEIRGMIKKELAARKKLNSNRSIEIDRSRSGRQH